MQNIFNVLLTCSFIKCISKRLTIMICKNVFCFTVCTDVNCLECTAAEQCKTCADRYYTSNSKNCTGKISCYISGAILSLQYSNLFENIIITLALSLIVISSSLSIFFIYSHMLGKPIWICMQ